MIERNDIHLDYQLHNQNKHICISDRAIGFYPESAKPTGHVYVYENNAWACPSSKYTPTTARQYAHALIEMADRIDGTK